jgi:hypothetical protein
MARRGGAPHRAIAVPADNAKRPTAAGCLPPDGVGHRGSSVRSGASAPVAGGNAEGVAEDAAEVGRVEETPAGSHGAY